MWESMRRLVEEADRGQWALLPECLDDFIDESNPDVARSAPVPRPISVRVIDAAEDARSYQGLVAGAPQGVDVDLSLVRIPEDWLIFPSRAGQPSAPRHPDSVTKQFANRGKKILGFSIRLHDLRVTHGTWLLDQGNANPQHTHRVSPVVV
jgi:hypothetical protein